MPVEGIRRPAWAEISATAIAHNAAALRTILGNVRLCAVVKANGYGHGAEIAATAALRAGADALAVAIVDEGIELRGVGVSAPILLLAEITADTLADAMTHTLTLTIGSLDGARSAVKVAEQLGGRHTVHLKVDTGMHRMGVSPAEVDEAVAILQGSEHIDLEGIYTHFSVADGESDESRSFTATQLQAFEDLVNDLARRGVTFRLVHAANSAGTIGWAGSRLDMVRVGLALYGYLPAPWLEEALRDARQHLEPALTLRAQVVATRRALAGERPSYGRARALTHDATIVTVPFGYADGYPRRLFEAGASVLIRGRRFPLAGNVTMDQLLIDVGDEDVQAGEDVVLLGRQGDEWISADEWAQRGGTISWEILCGIGARVPRVLVD